MAEGRQLNLKNPAVKRILQEIKELDKNPSKDYITMPLEEDIFEWQFAIHGPKDSEFEGGIYHGRIILPAEYPFKPPSFMLLTPSGRFEVQTKICLSISNYHPEHWQPSWSVRTALVALNAFMPSAPNGAVGSLDLPKEDRRVLAIRSRQTAPKYGSAERQKIMEHIHSQMLESAPPVPSCVAQPDRSCSQQANGIQPQAVAATQAATERHEAQTPTSTSKATCGSIATASTTPAAEQPGLAGHSGPIASQPGLVDHPSPANHLPSSAHQLQPIKTLGAAAQVQDQSANPSVAREVLSQGGVAAAALSTNPLDARNHRSSSAATTGSVPFSSSPLTSASAVLQGGAGEGGTNVAETVHSSATGTGGLYSRTTVNSNAAAKSRQSSDSPACSSQVVQASDTSLGLLGWALVVAIIALIARRIVLHMMPYL